MEFSVVIPTYNRATILAETLGALAKQSICVSGQGPGFSWEVIVVDDGSTDSTRAVVESQRAGFPVHLAYQYQQNRKQGAARNLGARHARGSFLVFLGDDIIPCPDFLARHWEAREARGETGQDSKLVVIGYTRWGQELRVTRFMDYIGERGWQFGFSLIKDPDTVPFNFFYTSNIAIGRQLFLESGGFDEEFQEYGWEDIELSLRLQNAGMRLVYQKLAIGHHVHPTTIRSFISRQIKVGFSAWKFYRIHPEMSDFLNVFRVPRYSLADHVRMRTLTWACRLTEQRGTPDLTRFYPDLMSYYYNLGILKARNDKRA